MKAEPEHFATVVRNRRRQLNLGLVEVHAAGGPAHNTQGKAERGELVPAKPVTFRKYDVGLRWEPGSAARVYWERGQPTPLPEHHGSPAAPAPGPALETGEMTTLLPLERLLALMGVQRELNGLAERSGSVPARELRSVAERLDREVSIVVGGWATDLLERNRGRGTGVHPLLEIAFADALAAPVRPDAPDAEERLYRRWLIGGTAAEGIDEDARARFELRYQSSRGQGVSDDR